MTRVEMLVNSAEHWTCYQLTSFSARSCVGFRYNLAIFGGATSANVTPVE